MIRTVSPNWYKNLYKDVFESGIDPQFHFAKYGKSEKRFSNPLTFLNQFENSPLFLNLIITILFYSIPKFSNYKFATTLFNLCIKYEVSKFKDFNFDEICIASSLKDGVAEATMIYNSKFSNFKYFGVLKGLPHTNGTDMYPMVLEIWRNSEIVKKIPLIFPFFDLHFYDKNISKINRIFIQHLFQIEVTVSYFIKNFNFTSFTFFIHDFYLFTSKYHLYDEVSKKNYTFDYASRNFPNNKIQLNEFIDRVDNFICPSKFMYDKCVKYIPRNKLIWLYPPEKENIENLPVQNIEKQDTHSILIIGNLGNYKGSQLIYNVKNLIEKGHHPYRFLHIGSNPIFQNDKFYTNISNLDRQELLILCKKLPISFAFLPFQADETYSFTLSDIFMLQLPLITSNVGAIPERCLNRELTFLMSRDTSAKSVIDLFNKLITTRVNKNFNKSDIPEILKMKRKRISSTYDFPSNNSKITDANK